MKVLSDNDYELFFRLSSAYHAVALSATAPVVVPAEISFDDRVSVFSYIFYDCCDDEQQAREIMRRRITNCATEIISHYSLHHEMYDSFMAFEEAANRNNRTDAYTAAVRIGESLYKYVGLVQRHKAEERSPFLTYPACLAGHYFVIPGDERIGENEFNPEQTYEGAMQHVNALSLLTPCPGLPSDSSPVMIGSFSKSLCGVKLTDLHDTGEGISDTSLRGRLALTEELLRRVGFDIGSSV